MAGNNFRWVCTDRRTDVEILKEIAQADTSVVILSREDPTRLLAVRLIARKSFEKEIHLLEWPTDRQEFRWAQISNWPEELRLLVTDPSSFGLIAIFSLSRLQGAADPGVTSLRDWLLLRQCDGTGVFSIQTAEVPRLSPLGDSPRRILCPGGSSRLSDRLRTRIRNLAGIAFPANSPDVTALRAGLFQWHDALDESHECSQSIEGQGKHRAGDYWHAIMHRREPDYGNSKYWFRAVGRHPIFDELGRKAKPLIAAAAPEWQARLLKDGWNPFAFVDLCENVADGRNEAWVTLAEAIQELEMLLLLDSTYQDARRPA